MAVQPRPAFANIEDFLLISGLSRRQVYNLLAAKLITAHKQGNRVLVDVEQALDYIRSLPPPEVKPQTKRRAADILAVA